MVSRLDKFLITACAATALLEMAFFGYPYRYKIFTLEKQASIMHERYENNEKSLQEILKDKKWSIDARHLFYKEYAQHEKEIYMSQPHDNPYHDAEELWTDIRVRTEYKLMQRGVPVDVFYPGASKRIEKMIDFYTSPYQGPDKSKK